MPLFEFRCRDCGSRFEVLTSYEQSQGQMLCALCQSANVRKLVPLVAKRGKGGDFADSFGGDDYMDEGDDMDNAGGGGCSCGGACSCQN